MRRFNSRFQCTPVQSGKRSRAKSSQEFGGQLNYITVNTQKAREWDDRAKKRKELINRYLWNSQRGMYFDYDVFRERKLDYVSATTFYPL